MVEENFESFIMVKEIFESWYSEMFQIDLILLLLWPWLKKILKVDILKCSRLTYFYFYFDNLTIICSPWLIFLSMIFETIQIDIILLLTNNITSPLLIFFWKADKPNPDKKCYIFIFIFSQIVWYKQHRSIQTYNIPKVVRASISIIIIVKSRFLRKSKEKSIFEFILLYGDISLKKAKIIQYFEV